jgi:hypothetical protein
MTVGVDGRRLRTIANLRAPGDPNMVGGMLGNWWSDGDLTLWVDGDVVETRDRPHPRLHVVLRAPLHRTIETFDRR